MKMTNGGKCVEILEEDYMEATDLYLGWCVNCWAFTRECTEPDARDYDCPQCEENSVCWSRRGFDVWYYLILGRIQMQKFKYLTSLLLANFACVTEPTNANPGLDDIPDAGMKDASKPDSSNIEADVITSAQTYHLNGTVVGYVGSDCYGVGLSTTYHLTIDGDTVTISHPYGSMCDILHTLDTMVVACQSDVAYVVLTVPFVGDGRLYHRERNSKCDVVLNLTVVE